MTASTLLSYFIQKASKSNTKIIYKVLMLISSSTPSFIGSGTKPRALAYQTSISPVSYTPSTNVQGFNPVKSGGSLCYHITFLLSPIWNIEGHLSL